MLVRSPFLILAISCVFAASIIGCSSGSTTEQPATPDGEAPQLDGGGDAEVVDAGGELDPAAYPLPTGYRGVGFLVNDPVRKFKVAPPVVTDAAYNYLWVIESDQGRVELDLNLEAAPITANSCVFLTLHRYYDGLAFHRVIAGFVAQSGDPNTLSARTTTWGQGGPGYRYGTEVRPGVNFDGPGVLGSARGDELDTNGSQFFITLAAVPDLNQIYTVFGKVRSGIDVVQKIVAGEPPAVPTRIKRAYIGRKPR
jgi:peptidylprolyl isomerase